MTCTTQEKLCDFSLAPRCFALKKTFTTERSVSGLVLYYRIHVFEIKNQKLPAPLKLEAASSGTLVCPTYKPHDRNYTTFSKLIP